MAGVVDVVGDDAGEFVALGEVCEAGYEDGVVGLPVVLELEVELVGAEEADEAAGGVVGAAPFAGEEGGGDLAAAAAGEGDEAVGAAEELVVGEGGVAFGGVGLGAADEVSEVVPAVLVFDEEGEVGAALQGELGAEDGVDAVLVGGAQEAGGAVDGVVVGEGQGGHAELGGAAHEVFGVAGAVEEGEVGVGVEFGVGKGLGIGD